MDVISTSRASIVRYFSLAAGAFVLVLLVTAPFRSETALVMGSYAGLLLVFGSALALQRPRPSLAGALCSLGTFFFVVALTWARGGVLSPPGLAAFSTLVALTGLFWSGLGSFLIASLSSVVVAVFVQLGPDTPGMSRVQVWLELTFQFFVIALIAHLALSLVRRSVTEAVAHQEARKEFEARINRLQSIEALGRLAGGIAHDFNNLLTIILGGTEMLLSRNSDSRFHTDVERIRDAAERASALTGQLLAVGKKQVLTPRVISPKETLESLHPLLVRLLPENVQLVVDCDALTGNVEVDEARLEQVLINLVTNANDSMPEGGKIRVSTRNRFLSQEDLAERDDLSEGEYVEVAVSDDGVGMSDELQARIFEPFFTTKQGNRGTGLGLAVVHGIVLQSNGHISLQTALGQGSTFFIYFRKSTKELAPKQNTEQESPPLSPKRILLVEDSDDVRAATGRMLVSLGHEVSYATDGSDALQRYSARLMSFDLIVTDIVMPVMGGTELARRLRERVPGLPVLFISGYPNDELTDETTWVRSRYLPKPFSVSTLQEELEMLLSASQSGSEQLGEFLPERA